MIYFCTFPQGVSVFSFKKGTKNCFHFSRRYTSRKRRKKLLKVNSVDRFKLENYFWEDGKFVRNKLNSIAVYWGYCGVFKDHWDVCEFWFDLKGKLLNSFGKFPQKRMKLNLKRLSNNPIDTKASITFQPSTLWHKLIKNQVDSRKNTNSHYSQKVINMMDQILRHVIHERFLLHNSKAFKRNFHHEKIVLKEFQMWSLSTFKEIFEIECGTNFFSALNVNVQWSAIFDWYKV